MLIQGWGFNTQPPEGGWAVVRYPDNMDLWVSTHSRLKAAGRTWLTG